MRSTFSQKLNNRWQKIIHSDVRQSSTKKICATIIAIFAAFAISLIIACSVCKTWGSFGKVINTIFTAGYKVQYQNTLFSNMAILIVGGLAFIFAYKAGLFNIGISGQMVAGATAATLICHLAKITPGLNQVIILFVSMGIGALVAAIVGALKAYLKVNEVVSSIMFNWIIYFMSILTFSSIKAIPHDSSDLNTNAPADNLLFRINGESWIPLMILAIALIIIVAVILNYTVFGRKQKVTGLSNSGALAAGYNVKTNMISSMAISGAISGILGVMLYCGFSPNMPITAAAKVIPQEGFNGISVGLISMCSPMASIPISLFFSMIKTSVSELQAIGIDNHIADVVFGIVVYGAAAIALFLNIKPYWFTLELFRGTNYSKIKHERNMTNIELLSISNDQCEILRKYFVYYQKTVNVKSTLKLSPAIRFKMWLGNIQYNRTLKKSERNVKRNTRIDIYSYKPLFKQEMAHIIKHNGVLLVDFDQSKRGGWYIKVTDFVLRAPDLHQRIEEETETRCNANLIKQLHQVNNNFKEKPFDSRQIRLLPKLAYLQNVRTGLKYRDQISKENKLSYFTFIQTRRQAESIGLSEIRSRKQYHFAYDVYLKAYQRTFDIVKKHYDIMERTFGRNKQLNIYGVRFDQIHLEQLYLNNLKEEIATIAHLINCPLSRAQLRTINSLLIHKSNLEQDMKQNRAEADKCRALSKKYLDESKVFNAEIIKDRDETKVTNDKIATIVARARYDEKQNRQQEVDKIDISNAKVDAKLKKIAKQQERKELRELKAIKLAKYKEQKAKEKQLRQEKIQKEKEKDLAFKAKLAAEKAAELQAKKDERYAIYKQEVALAKQRRAEAKAAQAEERQAVKKQKAKEKQAALVEKQRLMAKKAVEKVQLKKERDEQKQLRIEQRKLEKQQRIADKKAKAEEAKEAKRILKQQQIEKQKQEAAERAEQERLEAIERAKQEKIRKEQERREAIARAKQEKKEAIARAKQEEKERKARIAFEKKEAIKRAKQKAIEEEKAKIERQKAKEAEREKRKQKALEEKQAREEKRQRLLEKRRLAKQKAEKKEKQARLKQEQKKAKQEAKRRQHEREEAKREALKQKKKEAKYREKLSTPIVSRWEKIQKKRLAKEAKKAQKENKKGGK